jgi:hypothetical protein
VKVNIGVCREEFVDALGLVRREVVGDDVDFLAARLVDDDVGEERNDYGRGVALGGLAQHFHSLGVEGGVQRQGAMAEVLESVPLGTSRRQWQNRVESIQGLNGSRSASKRRFLRLM